jgi:tricorn protease interacting factor F2/3
MDFSAKILLEIELYDLRLDVDFYALTFRAKERIRASKHDKSLVLDSLGLTINRIECEGKSLSFEEDRKKAKLTLLGIPERDPICIEIEYEGKVSEGALYGVYKSKFGSDYFITTDFEPTGARMLFPCVDNPSYKSIFHLEVTTQKNLSVISNTQISSEQDLQDRVRFVFKETPRMPTYIFYLGIGKFEQKVLQDNHLEFRVDARSGFASKGAFVLENTAKYVRAFEDYYSVPYPLQKIDLIALPEYAAGAMENWGAITFREVAMLIDENSSFANRRRVALILGHELAHQWFGDLVTMKWWNDLWLSESFATYMEKKMTIALYPEWDELSGFLLESTAEGMLGDSLKSSHPINAVVDTPEEISQIFDEISYEKGASVLRMINDYLGEDSFKNGVSKYLQEFKFSNAKGSDFWEKLEESSNIPVNRIVDVWINKPGYPLLSVSADSGGLLLKQKRFLLDPNSKLDQDEIWPIPITLMINGRTEKLLMEERETKRSLANELEQIKANFGQAGFYRVLYDEKLYSLIIDNFASLNPYDKWGIISDLFAFLESGMVSRDAYFQFVGRCLNSAEYLVAITIANQLTLLHRIVPDDNSISRALVEFCKKQIERLGLDQKLGERETDKILRENAATELAKEDTGFARLLSNRFPDYEKLDPNLRAAAAIGMALTEGSQGFDEIVKTMKKMGNEADIIKLYEGLTSFKDTSLVKKALDFCLSGEVSRADSLYAIEFALENASANDIVWSWITANISALRELFRGTPYVGKLFQYGVPFLALGHEKEVQHYFDTHPMEEAVAGINKGMELLGIYSNLRSRLNLN